VLFIEADACWSGFNKILKVALALIDQNPSLARLHCTIQADRFLLHFWALLDAMLYGICIHHRLLSLLEISYWMEDLYFGRSHFHRMEEPVAVILVVDHGFG